MAFLRFCLKNHSRLRGLTLQGEQPAIVMPQLPAYHSGREPEQIPPSSCWPSWWRRAPPWPSRPAPTTGVRRLPGDVEKPEPPPSSPSSPAPSAQERPPSAAPAPSTQAVAASPLSAAEIAAFTTALKAIDDSRWADAKGSRRQLPQHAARPLRRLEHPAGAPRTESELRRDMAVPARTADWPEPEVLRRQAEERIGPETPATEVVRYFTAFPPLTSTATCAGWRPPPRGGAQRRPPFRPRHLAECDAGAIRTRRLPQSVRPVPHRGRPGRPLRPYLREGRPQVPATWCRNCAGLSAVANARLAMANRAADAATS